MVYVKVIKKGAVILLSAAIFGGVAGGVFNLVAENGKDKQDIQFWEKVCDETQDILFDYLVANNTFGDGFIDDSNSSTSIMTSSVVDSTGGITTKNSIDVSDIVSECMPSVVAITIKSVQEYNAYFGQTYQYETEGSGSGIIVGQNDTELLIVTNNHVVSGAESVTVGFIDGTAVEAKVKGTDSENDLAIVVINLEDIPEETKGQIKIATMGSSDNLKVGEQVVAIGNALGYGQSVTTGIVSAKDRSNSTNQTPLIQTDAAINPGNSGGALLNMQGELVGINSSKYASTDVEGMGYAIPISKVKDVIDRLSNMETRDKVDEAEMGYMGVTLVTIDEATSEYYNMPQGAYIQQIEDISPAKRAGLTTKSVIVKFDGCSISSAEELVGKLEYYKAGEKVTVECKVLENGEYISKTYELILGKRN